MADNPLQDTPARDTRIRERAYHLWQADGEPHGGDLEYWERARELIAIEDSPVARDTAVQGASVDEASIQENYGEFPGLQSDQGERRPTPMTRAQLRKSAQVK